MTQRVECVACGSDDVEPMYASYSTYQCLTCGEVFDEYEDAEREFGEDDFDDD